MRPTATARRSMSITRELGRGPYSRGALAAMGVCADLIATELAAGRWQQVGNAILLHNGPVPFEQYAEAVRLNCGPRAVLTSFTAAASWGLKGWARPDVHVLAPAGTRRARLPRLVLHRAGDWSSVDLARGRDLHRLAGALVVAAGSFESPRPACGILAAAVQQRLANASELIAAVEAAPRVRHRACLLLALRDIAQGAESLAEIDFGRLCGRFGLPPPVRQSVRVDRSGRRRYLDAEWIRADGQRVVVEVDGALHLKWERWTSDQLRQNEVVLAGSRILLRFPSIVLRLQPELVADQLGRALGVQLRRSRCSSGPIEPEPHQDH